MTKVDVAEIDGDLLTIARPGSKLAHIVGHPYTIQFTSTRMGYYVRLAEFQAASLEEEQEMAASETGTSLSRRASGRWKELPALAHQLAAANPDAIIAAGNAVGAAQEATSTTPIIGSFIGEDPAKSCRCRSPARTVAR